MSNELEKIKELVDEIPNELKIKAVSFLGELIGQPLREVGNIAFDNIRYLRIKNQVRLLLKAKEYFINNGLEPQKVPTQILVPLLEQGSLEENETLSEKWTALLVNASYLNGNSVRPSYIDILKQLTPLEAQILDYLFNQYKDYDFPLRHVKKRVFSEFKIDEKELLICIDNFLRLKLWNSELPDKLYELMSNAEDKKKLEIMFYEKATYSFTMLGKDFIESCRLK
ncbi:Abi-alpha family protein [Clostridium sp. DJ247]|uniref:Abi-alpha family protein n=1 Tax=Clostridium sp. DJ247 TaxID=2726188 RepID=UPI001629F634|nr:Abi-alpha family protein [Clostridium sp. DJ247]MBC2581392.1 DUF4393 domain-containing protein [Clostridium sp. DJ247]